MYPYDIRIAQRLGHDRLPPLLSNWQRTAAGAVEGAVHGDPRFRDGARVRTSRAVLFAPPLLVTCNSVYRLAPRP